MPKRPRSPRLQPLPATASITIRTVRRCIGPPQRPCHPRRSSYQMIRHRVPEDRPQNHLCEARVRHHRQRLWDLLSEKPHGMGSTVETAREGRTRIAAYRVPQINRWHSVAPETNSSTCDQTTVSTALASLASPGQTAPRAQPPRNRRRHHHRAPRPGSAVATVKGSTVQQLEYWQPVAGPVPLW